MRFAHMADVHIGSWREPKLNDISIKVFSKAADIIIERKADLLLISGDLFNTSMPAIDKLKSVVVDLKKLKDNGIRTYVVAGSHDFSPSGKTMLDVLEEAGLFVNVVRGEVQDEKLRLKFTSDEKTGVKITGMLGRKGMLEKKYYENLQLDNLEQEEGYKIFMFHTALSEFKPKEMENMESSPLSFLPRGFDYYAGGHVHYIFDKIEEGYGRIAYPGALFPANFSELEKFHHGGFYMVSEDSFEYVPVKLYDVLNINIDCNGMTPGQVEAELKSYASGSEADMLNDKNLKDKIITIRFHGILESGKVSDIDFNSVFEVFYSYGAYFVMKNTSALQTKEFEDIKVKAGEVDAIELETIKEHLGQVKIDNYDEEKITLQMMRSLETVKAEGEKNADFEKRVLSEIKAVLELGDVL